MVDLLRFVYMGTTSTSAGLLERCCRMGNSPMAVVTREDKPQGRGLKTLPSPVKEMAESLGLPVYQPSSWREPKALLWLRAQNLDFVLIAAYGQILPADILNVPRLGVFNVHTSLLPKYRGPEPVRAAILANENETGVTFFRLERDVDSGPIVLQDRVKINPEDDAGMLTQKIFHRGAELLPDFFRALAEDALSLRPQNHAMATRTRKFSNHDAELSWEKSSHDLVNQVRAFGPDPGAYTFWGKKRLKIFRASNENIVTSQARGTVIPIDMAKGIPVSTGNGILWIRELQLEGKKRMVFTDFLSGQREFIPPIMLGSAQ